MSPTSRPGNGGSSRKCSTATSWSACTASARSSASSDPQVRESNVLFLPHAHAQAQRVFRQRRDLPRRHAAGRSLNDRFCEMVKEFVGKLGGGLVVIAGPRFGPQRNASDAAGRHAAGHCRSEGRAADRPAISRSSACGSRRMPAAISSCSSARTTSKTRRPGTTWASCRGISRWRCSTARARRLPGRASDRQCARRQDAAAADRRSAVRQGRSGLSRLQRNVAAAAASTARSITGSSGRS